MCPFNMGKDRSVLMIGTEIDIATIPGGIPGCQFRSAALRKLSHNQILIYIGTENGKIILLSWDPCSSDSVLLACRAVGRHAVKGIYPLQESNIVAVLAGEFVLLMDGFLHDSLRPLPFTKGASAMTTRLLSPGQKEGEGEGEGDGHGEEGEGEVSRQAHGFLHKIGRTNRKVSANKLGFGRKSQTSQLAVAAGRRLFLCEVDSEQKGEGERDIVVREIACPEGVVSMGWVDNSIIVGTQDGYALIALGEEEEEGDGRSRGKGKGRANLSPIFALPDAAPPPLLKCFHGDRELLLIVDNVGIVVNVSGQPTAGSVVFKVSPDSIGQTGPYVVTAKNGQVEVYHRKTGFRVQSLSLTVSGHSVIADDIDGKFVVVATQSKVSCLLKVPVEEQLKELLRKKDYDEAVCLAEECVKEGVGSDAKERLSLVHAQAGFQLLFDLQFKEAVDHFLQSEVMQPSEIFPFIMPYPNRWSSMIPRNRYWGLHPPPQHIEQVIEKGLSNIQRGSLLKKAGITSGIYSVGETIPPNPSSRSALLESATQNIIRYLKACRDKSLAPVMKEGVDTLLMYLYRFLGITEEMEQLASSENSCVVEELEALLKESGHLRTLAFLYSSKGLQPQALEIWQVLVQRNLTMPLEGSSFARKKGNESTGFTPDQLAAAAEAAHILEESSDHKLVLKHLAWIIRMDQGLGIKVLTSVKRSRPLPPEEVFSAVDANAVDVHQRYLQWLIEEQGCKDTQFHTSYALLLAKEAIGASKSVTQSVTLHEDVAQSMADGMWNEEKKVLNDGFLTAKEVQNPNEESSKQCICLSTRNRLQSFLLNSDKYDAEAVLHLIEGSELWPEQAILYKKLGEETSVLQILALKLEDSDAAEQYCAELGRPEAYMQLLDMYLEPGEGKEPMYKAAVRLLHCHGELLDPLQVLEALSPDMPLQLASETLSRMLRARVHHHRQGQCYQQLRN
ncbi:vacuolar sorting protein 3 isoform X2 [Cryptomeria japonica]|uniref:vacuolar sorting protein 3 isoform X2 n=1 Tax=Cryptomeria japonica TaxID=3369 RepID=UPI0027DA1A49|nr:vacuolar sorting protein 3 isoform X2 [Cryptomeria japonica]